MADATHEPRKPLLASGGFIPPHAYPLIGGGGGCYIPLPEVTAARGGLDWGTVLPKRERTVDAPPEGAPAGCWHYGIRDEDGVVYSESSFYERSPFLSREEALDCWGHLDGAVVVRFWKTYAAWEDAPPIDADNTKESHS